MEGIKGQIVLEGMNSDRMFYRGKHVLVTGHTGFKGSWLCRMLVNAGAVVTGYSLNPPTKPNLFEMAGLIGKMNSIIGDVRDQKHLSEVFSEAKPEIVFHLAAQPLVRMSYENPVLTYGTNVMGTVNLLECVRETESVRSVLNVTTDKVYLNREQIKGYCEEDPLDGYDPYSNSKSCSELVTHSYVRSFFQDDTSPAVSTARAGNVIGGGDFSKDRIIPDCIRAMKAGSIIEVRNPDSVRPFQHVLEPLAAYLMIARKQFEDKRCAGCYNVGPDECDSITTGELVDLFCRIWGNGARWENRAEKNPPHEAGLLSLDCSRIKEIIGWKPRWNIRECMELVCRFSKIWIAGGDIPAEMDREINELEK